MIRIYSFIVLLFDIVYLCMYTGYSILHTLYRIVCPRPTKSVQGEVAVVSVDWLVAITFFWSLQ